MDKDTANKGIFSDELEHDLQRAARSVPAFLSDALGVARDLAREWGANPIAMSPGVGVTAKSALRAAKECFETWHLAGVAVKNAANAVEQAAKRVGSSEKEG